MTSFQKHIFTVHEARRITHPVHPTVTKYLFSVRCKDLPTGISNSANSRDPNLNKRIYKEIRQSLNGQLSALGTFDLMNKGIIILAESVEMDQEDKRRWTVVVDKDRGGIVDGGHTAALIWEEQIANAIPDEQYVDIYIRTGLTDSISPDIISDISKGLNTSMQVKVESILDKKEAFEWIKNELAPEFDDLIKYAESDDGQYYVQDLIGVLECLNPWDYPSTGHTHPTQVATSISKIIERFSAECNAAKTSSTPGKYERMRPILREAMQLFQTIQADFPIMHNSNGAGRAGGLKMVDMARRENFVFHFADGRTEDKKLFKQATYPIFAAFRNYVVVNARGMAEWKGGFDAVLDEWQSCGPTLVSMTVELGRGIGTGPDQIAKHKPLWASLFNQVKVDMLEKRPPAVV